MSPDASASEDQGATPADLGSPPLDLGADLADRSDLGTLADEGVAIDLGEIEGDTLRARFYDRYGTLNFETTMTR